jgi:hypothetical protein
MIRIEPYFQDQQEKWDHFVYNESRNGTIFHEQRFLSYHGTTKFQDESLMLYSGTELLGVLPGIIENSIYKSHPGSSAGGLVFIQKAGLREVIHMIDAIIIYLKDKGIKQVEFKLAESIFSWPVSDELTYALWHRGFQIEKREISTCIPLSDDFKWSEWGRKKNIFDIRKAEKMGYQVILSNNPKVAWELVNKNLNQKYQKQPTHSLDEIMTLHSLYPSRIHSWLCINPNKEVVSSIICFEANANSIHCFYIAQDYDNVSINLLPFIFENILIEYQSKEFNWFNFGISSRGENIKWGILEFKERIGGRGVNRDTWVNINISTYNPLN